MSNKAFRHIRAALSPAINGEGLTLTEWLTAVSPFLSDLRPVATTHRIAWRNGEDPTEWRAYYASRRAA